MQLMALHHGGRLVGRKEIGMVPVHPVVGNPLVPDPLEVYALHRHAVEGLEAFHVLARSADCVQAVAHRELPLYGILFHPEVRRGGVVTRFLGMVDAGARDG
jgi:GMP synthase (glutamine-hydrolysing)